MALEIALLPAIANASDCAAPPEWLRLLLTCRGGKPSHYLTKLVNNVTWELSEAAPCVFR